MPPARTSDADLMQALQLMAREKNIDMERCVSALEDAMASAAKKQHRIKEPVRSKFNSSNGKFEAFIVKMVVEEVQDPLAEWTQEEAREQNPGAEIGDEILLEISTEGLGRIAAQSAKQVLYQRIREAERERIYNEYIGRAGEIVNGTVKRFERGDIIVDLGKTEAIAPKNEQSRHERYSQGERIRAVIVDVHTQPKGPQIVLSRTDPRLLIKLFEMEVPEIYDGTVVIKNAVRAPGERAKVAVYSRERDVDPVGACVGMKGSRVQSIIRELRGEKIDIIEYSEDLVTFAQSALAPAKITRVSVTHHSTVPHLDVIVEDEQLSLAIGKRGQNVRLASELINCKIDIKSETDVKDEVAGALARMLQDAVGQETSPDPGQPEEPVELIDWDEAPAGISLKTGEALEAAGMGTYDTVMEAGIEKLDGFNGLDRQNAQELLDWATAQAAAEAAEAAETAGNGAAAMEEVAQQQNSSSPKMNEDQFMAALSKALKESEEERDNVQEAAAALPGGDSDTGDSDAGDAGDAGNSDEGTNSRSGDEGTN